MACLINRHEQQGELQGLQQQKSEWTFNLLHLKHLELMSSLFIYHTLRIMFNVSDNNSYGSGLCMGSVSHHLSQQSWEWHPGLSPSTSTSSEDMKFLKDEIAKMKNLINILVGHVGHLAEVANEFDEPDLNKLCCCSPLCSIFVIMAHGVVLFVTRESTRKSMGRSFPLGLVRM